MSQMQVLQLQQQADFGLYTGVPYLDAIAAVFALVYLTATPSVGLGLLDLLLLGPLDLVLNNLINPLSRDNVRVGLRIGDGSFGQVYSGSLGEAERAVVLKRCKSVTEAKQLQLVEEYMNRRARRSPRLRGSVAPYLGCYYNTAEGTRSDRTAPVLVWDDLGVETLERLLAQRDFPLCLEEELFGRSGSGDELARERRVVQRVMRQICTALAGMHRTGIVHRDLKPANLVLMGDRFRVIDFGAATDLRTGFNYDPELSLLDPGYCPPEQYVMPEDTPAPPAAPVAAALSPFIWAFNRPDLFDTYSAGIVLLQMGLRPLRSRNSVLPTGTFYRNLAQCDWDLREWRRLHAGPMWDFSILDSYGGAGWDLACKLVCKRDGLRRGRISASQAMLHPFLLGA